MNLINKNENIVPCIIPINSYLNPYEQRKKIYKDVQNKSGIYAWTHINSGDSYIGSTLNLSRRFTSYFSLPHLKFDAKNNNSLIIKALIEYNYSAFRLDVIEYCDLNSILTREQYYLDNFEFKYNILRVAGSMLGFKHSTSTKQRMSISRLGRIHSEATRLKLFTNKKAIPLKIKNIKTGEILFSSSIRRTAKFLNMGHSYLARCLNNNNYYKGRGYYVIKN